VHMWLLGGGGMMLGILVENIWLNDIFLKRYFVDTATTLAFDTKAFGGHDVWYFGPLAFG
jgi:hypothetical protein